MAAWVSRGAGALPRQEVPNLTGEVHPAISTAAVLLRAWRPDVLRFTVNAIRNGALAPTPLADVEPVTDGEPLDVAGRHGRSTLRATPAATPPTTCPTAES